MLLYAGIASLYSFKYSILIDIVKKLKRWSQSAGNQILYNKKVGTSETLRNNTEQVKKISIHQSKHLKPLNDEQFGHYLAGLIDGDGHFSTQQQLVIAFSHSDIKLAYYIKKRLEFGHVKKVKNQNAFIYVISNKLGIFKVLCLINGKLRTINKFNQVINHILNKYTDYKMVFTINTSNDFKNHWIAGFSDADASFQIKVINRIGMRQSVRFNLQIDQKTNNVLLLFKSFFGGNIGYRQSQDTYYYCSTSFGSARKVIAYFDKYHLQSSKYISYIKWRKVYIIIQDRKHLTDIGVNKIIDIKKKLNKHSV